MKLHAQAYAAALVATPLEPAPLRASRLCRTERERMSRRLSAAMLSAGWSIGMLARSLDVGRSFARGLRAGTRRLNAEHLTTLLGFPRMKAALERVGLVGEGGAT